VVIASILCISVILLISMVHDAGCVARAVNGGACPANPFALINFHLSAFTHLAEVLISAFFALFLILLVSESRRLLVVSCQSRLVLVPISSTSQRRVMRWLALREKSPTRVS
jgi:hypothetical protein